MTGMTDWQLFIEGSSEEAAIRFIDSYAVTGDQPTLRNCATALIDCGNWDLAREMWDTVIKHATELNKTADEDFINRGIIEWMDGQPWKAIDLWRLSLETVYTDIAGGVIGPAVLWFAGYRLNDAKLLKEATKLLRKFKLGERAKSIRFWPGPRGVASYLLDEVDTETFLNVWREGPALSFRRDCVANFWASVREPDERIAIRRLKQALVDKGAILECEYFLAKHELRLRVQ